MKEIGREEIVDAGAWALAAALAERHPGLDPHPDENDFLDATAIVSAIEPLIRRDEARRMNERWRTQVLDNERTQMRDELKAHLIAEVKELRDLMSPSNGAVAMADAVLDLLGEKAEEGEMTVSREALRASVMALQPDESGRVSKGLVLAMIDAEVQ